MTTILLSKYNLFRREIKILNPLDCCTVGCLRRSTVNPMLIGRYVMLAAISEFKKV
jgi:hypothetical protein